MAAVFVSADAVSDWFIWRGNRHGGDSQLSRLASENKTAEFRSTLSDALNLVFLMTIPSACGLIVFGEPIVRLIYEGGKLRDFDTNMTSWALAAYSVGLAGYAAIKVLSPSFYALDDAKRRCMSALLRFSFTSGRVIR